MSDLAVNSGPPLHGLHTILLENSLVRIVLLPEVGARIWQITYKPLNANLLWNNPALLPSKQPLYASYDDNWSGGWDELFPNDEAASFHGASFPDHGELWTSEWSVKQVQCDDAAGVYLRCITPISNFAAEKTLLLRPESSVLEVKYSLTNEGNQPFPFLWKLHPAFAVSASHRIDFPRMTVVRETDFPGTLDGAPPIFPWPNAPIGGSALDLRSVPDASSRAMHFFYGTEMAAGWCGVTDRANRLAAALRFDPEIFSSCWLFATHGGWKDLNVAVLEPATGYPFRMQSMIDEGRARILATGERLETTVLFSIQEGLTSIGGVDPDGTILSGCED
jgi:hypothetical protein